MKNPVTILILVVLLVSCSQNKIKQSSKIVKDSSNYFSLSAFFKEQMVDVDLKNYSIQLHKELNGKKDSVTIDKEIFSKMASEFLTKDISAPEFRSKFNETVFHDLSTKSYTLNYKPASVDEPIQNIDILLDEDSKQVKRVFIRIEYLKSDTGVIEQWNWKANHSFQINKFSKASNGWVNNEFNSVIWNDTKK